MMEYTDTILAAFESAMMHLQKANKRLTIITIISLILTGAMFCTFMYFLTSYEITAEQITVDSTDGPANYIGNDNNGDINNGFSDSEEDNDKAEK